MKLTSKTCIIVHVVYYHSNSERSTKRHCSNFLWLFLVSSCFLKTNKKQERERFVLFSKYLLAMLSKLDISSVAQSCQTLCDPMDCSMPGLLVHHQLPEFTQTHVHRVGDAIQPSYPLLSPSSPAPDPSQHQSLFQWVNSSHEVAKVLELASFLPKKSQGWSPSEWTGWISLQSKGLSRAFCNTTVQKHQFFGPQSSSKSNSHIHTWLLKTP